MKSENLPVQKVVSVGRPSATRLYVLSERTLFPIAFRVLVGWARGDRLIAVDAAVRPLQGLLNRLAHHWWSAGRIGRCEDVDPAMPWVERLPWRAAYNDVHITVEERLHAQLSSDNAFPSRLALYHYAFRKARTDRVAELIPTLMVLEWLDRRAAPRSSWRLIGASPLLAWLYEAYYGRPAPFSPRGRLVDGTLSFLGLGIAWCWGLWQILSRMCIGPVKPRWYQLAVDYISPLDASVLSANVARPADGLIIARTPEFLDQARRDYPEFDSCLTRDGAVGILPGFRILFDLSAELGAICRLVRGNDPGVVARYASLVAKRGMYQVFTGRYRSRFHLGRDDYSMEHVIRTMELRRAGCVTLGLQHGLPKATFHHGWREVDYDFYFMIGTRLYWKYYRDAWPLSIRVLPMGCYRMTAEQRARLTQPRSKDIVFFPTLGLDLAQTTSEVIDVARHFRDRRIFVKMKKGRCLDELATFEALLLQRPENLIVVNESEDPYEILLDASYAVTSGTTLTGEALLFKVKTFVFDLDYSLKYFYYRDFPDMIVKSAHELISRIESIEAGREDYNFAALRELAEDPGKAFPEVLGDAIKSCEGETSGRCPQGGVLES